MKYKVEPRDISICSHRRLTSSFTPPLLHNSPQTTRRRLGTREVMVGGSRLVLAPVVRPNVRESNIRRSCRYLTCDLTGGHDPHLDGPRQVDSDIVGWQQRPSASGRARDRIRVYYRLGAGRSSRPEASAPSPTGMAPSFPTPTNDLKAVFPPKPQRPLFGRADGT